MRLKECHNAGMKELFTTYIYPVSVTIVMLALYLAGNFSLAKNRNKKIRRAKKKEVFDPTSGDTPKEIDDREIFNLGIDSIRSRFSFMQKLFPVFMLTLWMVILAIPYLSALPAIYISLVAAIVSVVLGIALRPFLENIIAGVIISFFQPFKVGDTVRIEGQYGVIERIDLTQCVLRVWDWQRFVIPNSKMLTKEFQNLTMHDTLIWAYVNFWVEPGCDLDEVETLAKDAARQSTYSLEKEEPVFWVMQLEKDSVECWIAAWAANPSEAWELKCDIRKGVHKRLMQQGIKFQSIQAKVENSQK